MIQFEYFRPKSLEEALSLSARFGDKGRFMAGGTEVINEIRGGRSKPEQIIDIKQVPGIGAITPTANGLILGPLTRIRDIEKSDYLQKYYPALSNAAGSMASTQVRNKATVGGNICRASPSADMIPPLLALSSTLKIMGINTEKTVPLNEFLVGPGRTIIKPGEIMTEIHVPGLPPYSACTYIKLSPRKQMDLAIVGVAITITTDASVSRCSYIKIALGAVSPTAVLAAKAAQLLTGNLLTDAVIAQAADMAATECKPVTDVRSSDWYRRKMVAVLVKRAITSSINSIEITGTPAYGQNN